jgi:hypothetical protein
VRVQVSQRARLSVCGVLRFCSQFCVVSIRRLSEGIMVDLRTVSREFLTEFIHMYHEYPCLWKVKSKEYTDRFIILFTDRCAAMDQTGRTADVTHLVSCMVTAVVTPRHLCHQTITMYSQASHAINQMSI